ncbi:MAG: hypothetical protein R3E12_12955 [Candidatus Eisenbacteria bacterium]
MLISSVMFYRFVLAFSLVTWISFFTYFLYPSAPSLVRPRLRSHPNFRASLQRIGRRQSGGG